MKTYLESFHRKLITIKNIEEKLEQEKDNLLVEVLKLAKSLEGDQATLHKAFGELYWTQDQIHADFLAKVIGMTAHELRQVAGQRESGYRCVDCDRSIMISSRTGKVEKWRGDALCSDCYQTRLYKGKSSLQEEREEEAQRSRELATMPYTEYLRTPEWKDRREVHLKSSKYSCQVCNGKEGPLDVHHRTYERRGNENWGDLITLCRECHDLFYQHGKLKKG